MTLVTHKLHYPRQRTQTAMDLHGVIPAYKYYCFVILKLVPHTGRGLFTLRDMGIVCDTVWFLT